MALSPHHIAACLGYLQRVSELAERLTRHNLTLDAETRADVAYIQRYALEVQKVIRENA